MNPATGDYAATHPHQPGTLGVVLVGAGRGERLGGEVPKAFITLHGRSLIEFGISVVTSLPHGGHLVIVVPESRAAQTLALVDQILPENSPWEVSVVPGGRERHESVRFGLDALHDSVDTVLVHDAARPFASAALFTHVASEVRRTGDSVIPALPVSDTLKRVDADGVVHDTVDRSALAAVQTPQGFPRETLAAAHATAALHADRHGASPSAAGAAADTAAGAAAGTAAHQTSDAPTDDAEVVQRAGGRVRTVPGELRAHKLTVPDDLAILEHFLTANALGIGEA